MGLRSGLVAGVLPAVLAGAGVLAVGQQAAAGSRPAAALPAAGIITTVAGGLGQGKPRNLSQAPEAVAAGPDGAVYVGDSIGVVRKFSDTSNWEKVIAGIGIHGMTGDGRPALKAELGKTTGLAVDGSGNVIIADGTNSRIRVVAKVAGTFYGRPMRAGDIYRVAGNLGAGSRGDGGPAVRAMVHPSAVSLDAAGNLLIADTGIADSRKRCEAGVGWGVGGDVVVAAAQVLHEGVTDGEGPR